MLPTDLTHAVFKYGLANLVLHRADGDTITLHLPYSKTINDVERLVRDNYEDIPLEVECETVFGLLKTTDRV